MSIPPSELIGSCVLGALFATQIGHTGGDYARFRVQPDPTNLVPQTHFYQPGAHKISSRLTSVTQSSGGIQPRANPLLGAPLATFCYGGIDPGAVHPQLTLIQGPVDAYEMPVGQSQAYAPNFIGAANLGGTTADPNQTPDFNDTGDVFGVGTGRNDFPTIPSVSGAPPFKVTSPLTTWNIWQIANIKDTVKAGITYTHGFGPNFPTGADQQGPRIRQHVSQDGQCAVVVTAQNTSAQVERIYPIAKDLCYQDGAMIYYPPTTNKLQVAPRPIKARGGSNCGFQLHFTHSRLSAMASGHSGKVTGGIQIFWGPQELPKKGGTVITNFRLDLLPGQIPELQFVNPRTGAYDTFPVKGPIFGDGEFSVYIHYVGPIMLIGFTPSTTDWNAFVPPVSDQDPHQTYSVNVPETAKLIMNFDNITSTFIYGPSAFSNYHPEHLVNQTNVNNNDDHGHVKVQFTVPDNDAFSNEAALAADFIAGQYHARDIAAFGLRSDGTPTVYRDPREAPGERVVSFRKIKHVSNPKSQHRTVLAEIRFESTIEGPQYHYVGGLRPDLLQTGGDVGLGAPGGATMPLVRDLPWGDISDFLTTWVVDFNYEGDNVSILKGIATVTLQNLTSTPRGRQIQAALEENMLGITLGAGQGSSKPYFQGQITSVVLTETAAGSTTVLTCQDIATVILERTLFPMQIVFTGSRYGKIIATCIAAAGLYDWYQPTSAQPLVNALSVHLGTKEVSACLANNVRGANKNEYIFGKIRSVLGIVIGPNALPAFFWDPNIGKLRLEWKQNLDFVDTIQGLGQRDPVTGETPLPNGLHGVMSNGGYQVTTNTDSLMTQFELYGRSSQAQVPMSTSRFFADALGEVSYQILRNMIGPSSGSTTPPELGYVGYRRSFRVQEGSRDFPDQTTLDTFANDLSRYARQTFQKLHFTVYVTQPLTIYGRFRVLTFDTIGGTDQTDLYLYSQIKYTFTKNINLITADIEGIRTCYEPR